MRDDGFRHATIVAGASRSAPTWRRRDNGRIRSCDSPGTIPNPRRGRSRTTRSDGACAMTVFDTPPSLRALREAPLPGEEGMAAEFGHVILRPRFRILVGVVRCSPRGDGGMRDDGFRHATAAAGTSRSVPYMEKKGCRPNSVN